MAKIFFHIDDIKIYVLVTEVSSFDSHWLSFTFPVKISFGGKFSPVFSNSVYEASASTARVDMNFPDMKFTLNFVKFHTFTK
jgi:hypothetical protein